MDAARRRLATLREQLSGGGAGSGGSNRGGAAEASTSTLAVAAPAHVSSSSAAGPASSSYARCAMKRDRCSLSLSRSHSNQHRREKSEQQLSTSERTLIRSETKFSPRPSTLSTPLITITRPPSPTSRIHGPVSAAPAVWVPCSPKSPASGLLSPSSGKEHSETIKLSEVLYHKGDSGSIARVTINRPGSRNAFTPRTVAELSCCLADARDDPRVGAVILTGAGDEAFCSGGDQRVRSDEGGYKGADGVPRLSVLDLQVQIRRLPKPVIALVKGYAVGGGHVLQVW